MMDIIIKVGKRLAELIQRLLDRYVPDKRIHQFIWFALLWLFGLLAVFTLAGLIRFLLGIA